jgi:trimeric autotransporter adhesin
MANQPKKYKKFVATAATATLVASAIVPVASAASFSDTAGNTHEAAISALAEAGVISGYPDGTFKPNKELTRSDVVKLLGKFLVTQGYEIPSDAVSSPRFSDLTSKSNKELLEYAAVVADAGVFAGSNGKLLAGDPITRENMAIVLVRMVNTLNDVSLEEYVASQKFDREVKDLNAAKAEARTAIDVLDFYDITTATNFLPKNTVTRGQFATFVNNVIKADFSGASATTGTVKAINATTVEVTYKEEVDNINALNFTIDGLEVKNAAVKQTDKKTVVLTTSAQTAGVEYTVKESGNEIGKFKGISAVIPTALTVSTTSVQGIVGQQVSVKAEVKVADGQSKAGIPVTFNVDPYDVNSDKVSSLNKAQVVEVTTDDKGVATYTYTQYNAGADQVVAYATGNASSRDFAKVYWGVKPILTLTTKDGVTVENGKAKTYTATYLDPVTGTPLSNKELNVTFKENIDASVNNDSTAVATDVNTGATAKPYESATSQSVLKVKTNAKGEATFTVTGSNTSVTPIVYVDSDALNTAGYNRINTRDLQATTETTKFVGGVYTFKFNKEEQFEAVAGKPFTYEVEVTKADGKPYAGGTVTVALHELIDSSLATNTTAEIVNNSKVKPIAGKSGVYTLQLDGNGKAKFDVKANNTEVSATPVVWVDINTASNIEGTLENEEPFKLAGTVIFRSEVIGGAELENTSDVTGIYGVSGTGLQQPNYAITLLDQAGSEYSRNDYAINRVTYTLTNTGNSPVNLTLGTTNFNIDTISNNNPASSVVIAAGGSVTVTGSASGYPKDVALEVSNANAGTVSVTGSVTTSVLRSGTWTNHNSYYAAGNDSTTWVAASPAATEVTGVVKGYQTVDGAADWGYALVQVDGTSTYQIVKYDQNNSYFTGTQTDFNRLTATNAAGFETAISLEDRISLKNGELRLINVDSSYKTGQVKGNADVIAPPSTTITQAMVNAITSSPNATAVKAALQNLSGFSEYIAADQDAVATALFNAAAAGANTIAALNGTYTTATANPKLTVAAIETTKEAIATAKALNLATSVGTLPGQVSQAAKTAFTNAITAAETALNGVINSAVASTSTNHVDTLTHVSTGAVKTLTDAKTAFETAIITDARAELGRVITEAETLLASGAREGTKAGDYGITKLTGLQSAVNAAKPIFNSTVSSDASLNAQFALVNTALTTAKNAKIEEVVVSSDVTGLVLTFSPSLQAAIAVTGSTTTVEDVAGTGTATVAVSASTVGGVTISLTGSGTIVDGDTITVLAQVKNVLNTSGTQDTVSLTLEFDAANAKWVLVSNDNFVAL